MPRKNDTAPAPAVEEPDATASAAGGPADTPQVVISEQSAGEDITPQLSERTLAEMEAGREALRKHASNP
jgi:hypothetical protein